MLPAWVADISHLLRRIGKQAAYTMKFAYNAMREININISQLSNRVATIWLNYPITDTSPIIYKAVSITCLFENIVSCQNTDYLFAVIRIIESILGWEFLSTLGYLLTVTPIGIIVANQVGYGYPKKKDLTDSCGFLPKPPIE